MGKSVVIILSLIIATIISFIGALPSLLWGLSLVNYFSTASIIFAVQLFIGGAWNYYVDMKNLREQRKIDAANELVDSVQNIQICCAYCGAINTAAILVGDNNTFECNTCKEINSVILSCSAARTTHPIMPKAELANIFKSIDSE